MNNRLMTCILCPNGCELSVQWEGQPSEETLALDGNLCPKGLSYALNELTHPQRTLTTSVRVLHGKQCLTSVKTAKPVPREAIESVRAALLPIVLEAPVQLGDVVLQDAAGTGVCIVVTRAVPRNEAGAES